jgi:hypothetical protein
LIALEREVNCCRRSVQAQRLVIVGIVAAAGVLLVSGVGQSAEPKKLLDELRVKRLAIVDDKGMERIVAGTNSDGTAGVTWVDRDGKYRIVAATASDGNAIVQWVDRDGKARITADTTPDGRASVQWLDRDGKQRIVAGTTTGGRTLLPIVDQRSKP